MLASLLEGHFTTEDGRLQAEVVRAAEMLDAPVTFNDTAHGLGVGGIDATFAQAVTELPFPTATLEVPVTSKVKLSVLAQVPFPVAATRSDDCAPFLVVNMTVCPCIWPGSDVLLTGNWVQLTEEMDQKSDQVPSVMVRL
jgi:hypothetical protein